MKRLIDGDLAAVSGNGRSTRDRLKEKLRHKQESKNENLQESQNKVISAPTSSEKSGKRKKRRKKPMKPPTVDGKKGKEEFAATREDKYTEKVTNANSKKIAVGDCFSELADDVLEDAMSMLEAAKENPSQNGMVSGFYRRKLVSERYNLITANLHQKLRRNQVVEQCMNERKKLIAELKREVEKQRTENSYSQNEMKALIQQFWNKSAQPSVNASQSLKGKGEAVSVSRSEMIRPWLHVQKPVEKKRRTVRKMNEEIPRQLSKMCAVTKSAGHSINTFFSRLNRMLTTDYADLRSFLQEIRQEHLAAAKEKIDAALKRMKPNELPQKALNVTPWRKPISMLEMKLMRSPSVKIDTPVSKAAIPEKKQTLIPEIEMQSLVIVMSGLTSTECSSARSFESLCKLGNKWDIVQQKIASKFLVSWINLKLNKGASLQRYEDMYPHKTDRMLDQGISRANVGITESLCGSGSAKSQFAVDYAELLRYIQMRSGNSNSKYLQENQSSMTPTIMQIRSILGVFAAQLRDIGVQNTAQLTRYLVKSLIQSASSKDDKMLETDSGIDGPLATGIEDIAYISKSTTNKERRDKSEAEINLRKDFHYTHTRSVSDTRNPFNDNRRVRQNASKEESINVKQLLKTENVPSLNKTEMTIAMQNEKHLGKVRIKDMESDIEQANKTSSTQAARIYIVKLHEQMFIKISFERGVKLRKKPTAMLSSRNNSRSNRASRFMKLYNAEKDEHSLLLMLSKKEKGIKIDSVKESDNQSIEMASAEDKNHIRIHAKDEVPEQKYEQSEVTKVLVDLEQTHYGIRLCMFD